MYAERYQQLVYFLVDARRTVAHPPGSTRKEVGEIILQGVLFPCW